MANVCACWTTTKSWRRPRRRVARAQAMVCPHCRATFRLNRALPFNALVLQENAILADFCKLDGSHVMQAGVRGEVRGYLRAVHLKVLYHLCAPRERRDQPPPRAKAKSNISTPNCVHCLCKHVVQECVGKNAGKTCQRLHVNELFMYTCRARGARAHRG